MKLGQVFGNTHTHLSDRVGERLAASGTGGAKVLGVPGNDSGTFPEQHPRTVLKARWLVAERESETLRPRYQRAACGIPRTKSGIVECFGSPSVHRSFHQQHEALGQGAIAPMQEQSSSPFELRQAEQRTQTAPPALFSHSGRRRP